MIYQFKMVMIFHRFLGQFTRSGQGWISASRASIAKVTELAGALHKIGRWARKSAEENKTTSDSIL